MLRLASAQIAFHLLNNVSDSNDSVQFEAPANFSLIKIEPSTFFSRFGFLHADAETEQEIIGSLSFISSQFFKNYVHIYAFSK